MTRSFDKDKHRQSVIEHAENARHTKCFSHVLTVALMTSLSYIADDVMTRSVDTDRSVPVIEHAENRGRTRCIDQSR